MKRFLVPLSGDDAKRQKKEEKEADKDSNNQTV